jgi:predicted phosphodiesterase
MKLAVLADIHGNWTALDVVLKDLDARDDVDMTWVLGDLAAHGPQPDVCTTVIRERHEADKEHFKVIGGNTDRYLVNNTRMARPVVKEANDYAAHQRIVRADNAVFGWSQGRLSWENYVYLSGLIGKELGETIPDYGYVMGYHAIPGDDEYNITPATPDEEALDSVLDRPLKLGVYGHIHQQLQRDLGSVMLVNPGSVGMSFQQPGHAQYAIITLANGTADVAFYNLPYNVEQALQLAQDAGHPAVDFLRETWTEGS